MRFASLGSGSRGNATLLQSGDTTLLIDCGFGLREASRRLARLGLAPAELSAVLLSHEHGDHAGGCGPLLRRHRLRLHATGGTLRAAAGCIGELPDACPINPHRSFTIGGIEITPVTVPHDAREPCQFVFSDGRHRLGLLTDTGSLTAHIRERFTGLDALLLEFNHDDGMLQRGPYPAALKRRVGGPLGHLSNAQAGRLLQEIDTGRLRHLVALHLSETNNTQELARHSAREVIGSHTTLTIATQEEGFGWIELD